MLNIKSTRRIKPPRCIIYGAGGIGKSTLASRAPGALFFQTEDGLNNVDAVSAGLFTTYTDFITALSDFCTHAAEYAQFKTVVIDSLDWLERLIWEHVAQENKVSSIEKIAYGRGYTFALAYFQTVLSILDEINKSGRAVLLLCHSRAELSGDPDAPDIKKNDLKLHKTSRSLVVEWADAVLYATRLRGTARGEASPRVLRVNDSPTYFSKTRYTVPDPCQFSIIEYFNAVAADQRRTTDDFDAVTSEGEDNAA